MFDTYCYQVGHTEYVNKKVDVTVKRAPTDESIRLWDEMKEKAYVSLLDSISIQDNLLNCAAIVFGDIFSNRIVVKYKFTLNGKLFSGETALKDAVFTQEDVVGYIYEELSRTIAKQLIMVLEKEVKL